MFYRSIRWRLQLWYGLILLFVLAGFGFTANRLQWANELRRVDQELAQRAEVLLGSLRNARGPGRPPDDEPGRPGPGQRPPSGPFRVAPEHAALFGDDTGFYYVVWRRAGQEWSSSTNTPGEVPVPPRPASAASGRAVRDRGIYREAFGFTPPGECVLVGRSLQPAVASLRQFTLWLAAIGAAVLVLGLAGGWWVATRAIRPVEEISATASRISGGNLSERISVADSGNELGRLADVLNSTFGRLESAFVQQQRFTADASHELRTPISVVLNQAQAALARERPAAEYREALAACQRAAQRMRQLTDSLLALARLDGAHEPPQRERFDLADTARQCIDLVRPLITERRQSIHADLVPAGCCGDPEQLSLVLTNLLTNAIQYNKDAGEIRVSTRCENDGVTLTVRDQGPGVPPESLEKIFDRFYRVDESRNRHTGGVGLGLAIAKACIEAGGGSITASNLEPHGLQMVVRLPAANPEPSP